jgi:UDP-3-O-[3-hydroxymyristoyl] glucosamine N-acyltransferase
MSMEHRYTVAEIATWVDGQVEGRADDHISGPSDLDSASSEHISFLGNSRYLKAALASQAGAILVPRDYRESSKGSLIRVDNPSEAFATVVARMTPPEPVRTSGIHPSAVISGDASVSPSAHIGAQVTIESGASIGEDTIVEAGCYIGHDVQIGADCHLHPNATVLRRTQIGSRVILFSGCVIGSDGFGYEFKEGRHQKIPQVGYVRIDDDVEIGAGTTIDRGRFDKTWIKEGSKIDNLVQIAHNVSIGPHAIIVAQNGISGSSHLGAYVTMGGQSAVVGHVQVGDQVTITAWTAVTKDITEPGIYRGGPAKPMRESMKIEALTQRLPELYKRLKALEDKIEADS